MDRFFHVTEKGSTVRTEIMAGITTFMAMAYILMVNAGMFSNPFGDGTDVLGVSYGAIYVATAISAVVGTLLIGLLAYATYDLTNYATLRPWTLTITLVDLVYGTVVVGLCTWVAFGTVRRLAGWGWV